MGSTYALEFNETVDSCEAGVQALLALLRHRADVRGHVLRTAFIDGAAAVTADASAAILAVVLGGGVDMRDTLPAVALVCARAVLHQTLNAFHVEVCLQRCDACGGHCGDLTARRTLDVVTHLTHVLAQTVLAEGVVTRQKLGLVVAVIEQVAADETHEHVLVAVCAATRGATASLHGVTLCLSRRSVAAVLFVLS